MTAEHYRIYRKIYEENSGRIYQYIYRKTRNHFDAEDLKQDVFVAFLFSLSSFIPCYPENSNGIKHWLFKAADFKLQHYWRTRQKQESAELSSELFPDIENPKNGIDLIEFSFPDWLTKEDKRLLSLKGCGYTLKEIAEQLGISHGACRMRYLRLKRELKNI